jgi:hypothetical protein
VTSVPICVLLEICTVHVCSEYCHYIPPGVAAHILLRDLEPLNLRGGVALHVEGDEGGVELVDVVLVHGRDELGLAPAWGPKTCSSSEIDIVAQTRTMCTRAH